MPGIPPFLRSTLTNNSVRPKALLFYKSVLNYLSPLSDYYAIIRKRQEILGGQIRKNDEISIWQPQSMEKL